MVGAERYGLARLKNLDTESRLKRNSVDVRRSVFFARDGN